MDQLALQATLVFTVVEAELEFCEVAHGVLGEVEVAIGAGDG
jgi:hypothetical protein